MANPQKLTKSALGVMRHLWEEPSMTAHFNDIRTASGATAKGFYTVLERLKAAGFIAASDVYASYALTFSGMCALKGHYEALYNNRPCEAYGLEVEKYSVIRKQVAA